MKLSSRKQLLKEAEEVLKNISKRRVNELDWEEHEGMTREPESQSSLKNKFIEWKLSKDLYEIEKKYKNRNAPDEKQKEIDELIILLDKLRKHFAPEKFKTIPRDPAQQTELQKLIVNAPPPKEGAKVAQDYLEFFVKDPETGMYYSKYKGTPDIPPELRSDYLDWSYNYSSANPWDYTRGWFYNVIKQILFGGTVS